jgi:2-polyprenyl-6-methoxyphenol hydroxylase-like FAD-dependent oxidoreductase
MSNVGSSKEIGMSAPRTSLSASAKKDLRIIIVGGSVAGLTLAHCLHHNNIDFVVLEAHNEIAPQVGASICVLPNGARILDQLGLLDDIVTMVEPMQRGLTWTGDGKLIVDSSGPLLTGTRSV